MSDAEKKVKKKEKKAKKEKKTDDQTTTPLPTAAVPGQGGGTTTAVASHPGSTGAPPAPGFPAGWGHHQHHLAAAGWDPYAAAAAQQQAFAAYHGHQIAHNPAAQQSQQLNMYAAAQLQQHAAGASSSAGGGGASGGAAAPSAGAASSTSRNGAGAGSFRTSAGEDAQQGGGHADKFLSASTVGKQTSSVSEKSDRGGRGGGTERAGAGDQHGKSKKKKKKAAKRRKAVSSDSYSSSSDSDSDDPARGKNSNTMEQRTVANPFARYAHGQQPPAQPGAGVPRSGEYTSEKLEAIGIHENPDLAEGLMEWVEQNRIDKDAFVRIRCLTVEYQRKVMDKGYVGDVANPSNVLIARIRDMLKHPILGAPRPTKKNRTHEPSVEEKQHQEDLRALEMQHRHNAQQEHHQQRMRQRFDEREGKGGGKGYGDGYRGYGKWGRAHAAPEVIGPSLTDQLEQSRGGRHHKGGGGGYQHHNSHQHQQAIKGGPGVGAGGHSGTQQQLENGGAHQLHQAPPGAHGAGHQLAALTMTNNGVPVNLVPGPPPPGLMNKNKGHPHRHNGVGLVPGAPPAHLVPGPPPAPSHLVPGLPPGAPGGQPHFAAQPQPQHLVMQPGAVPAQLVPGLPPGLVLGLPPSRDQQYQQIAGGSHQTATVDGGQTITTTGEVSHHGSTTPQSRPQPAYGFHPTTGVETGSTNQQAQLAATQQPVAPEMQQLHMMGNKGAGYHPSHHPGPYGKGFAGASFPQQQPV